jgi:pSer/pThr/pTyr-binding forkhead associated (FHA) protein
MLAISLYGFLGFTIWVQWRSLNETRSGQEAAQTPLFVLINQSDKKKEEFSKADIYIGRESTSDLMVNNETISLQHARIFYKNGQWLLEDLNSTNGTYINDERVFTPTVLVAGDLVAFGNEIFEVVV